MLKFVYKNKNMRLFQLVALCICISLFACEETAPTTDTTTSSQTPIKSSTTEPKTITETKTSTNPKENPTEEYNNEGTTITDAAIQPKGTTKNTHDCTAKGTQVEGGNNIWMKAQNTLLCVVADKSTADKNLGDSHRKLVSYNTNDCSLIFERLLPINVSADFPYYIKEDLYKADKGLAFIKGFRNIHCYDANAQTLLPIMNPKYLTDREAQDAQSGMIKELKFENQYLFGYATDFGSFAFDLTDKKKMKPVLPSAERGSQALYFQEKEKGFFQAYIPKMNDDEVLSLKALFSKAKKLNPVIPKSVQNNRFLVLKEVVGTEKQAVAIDMNKGVLIDLPKDVRSKNTKEILTWLKKLK